MNFMADQLNRLNVRFNRLDANTSGSLPSDQNDPYWNAWERPIKSSEKAVSYTHLTLPTTPYV